MLPTLMHNNSGNKEIGHSTLVYKVDMLIKQFRAFDITGWIADMLALSLIKEKNKLKLNDFNL